MKKLDKFIKLAITLAFTGVVFSCEDAATSNEASDKNEASNGNLPSGYFRLSSVSPDSGELIKIFFFKHWNLHHRAIWLSRAKLRRY